MQLGRVYMIVSPSGRVYIGSTIQTFKKRWRHYFKLSCKSQIKLYNSLKKYGVENHMFYELWEGDMNLMLQKETEFGKFYDVLGKNGLNLRLPNIGDIYKSVSEETREKMSNSRKGIKISEETRKKLGKAPVFQSEEFKNKISLIHKGKIISEETRNKLRIAKKGNCKEIIEKLAIMKRIPIIQYDLEGNFIKEWSSMSEVQRELKIDKSQISGCCKNKLRNKTAGGFIWKYKNKMF